MERFYNKNNRGQTLIETLVATFILAMGITAATGLALYAFSTSTNVTKQIIATGLAREGLEAVRNMRDTNWLKLAESPGIDKNCYNFSSSPIGSTSPAALSCPGTNIGGRCCYKSWLGIGGPWNNPNKRGYNFTTPNAITTYTISVDSSNSLKTWNFVQTNSNFGLDFNTDASSTGFFGYYVPNTSAANGSSEYYRKITIVPITDPPFNTDNLGVGQQLGPKLRVLSQVWWTDKKCPRVSNYDLANAACKVQLETELSNWKNYQ